MRPNASENGQISPSTTVRAARGGGSCPNCAFALQGARKIENIQASSGVIWGIPAEMILSLAAGEVSEESLTRWIRDNWPREPGK